MAGTVERTLALKLIGDVSDLKKPLAQADRQFGRLTKSALSWGKALGGALVIGGLERLVGSVGEGVKAFREEQDAVRNFQRSVKNMGMPLKAATKALDAMADRAVDLGFDDGDMIAGMDAFLKRTGDIAKATEMNNLAMDIARSRNISLAAAQKVVEGIYNGSARALKAYGIEGKKGMEAVEAARERERGKAAAWARNHPMEVMLGKVSDAWADLVGNLSKGDIGGALDALSGIGEAIMDGLFGGKGKDGIRNSTTKGLVNVINSAVKNATGIDFTPLFAGVQAAADMIGNLSKSIKDLTGFGPAAQVAILGLAAAVAVLVAVSIAHPILLLVTAIAALAAVTATAVKDDWFGQFAKGIEDNRQALKDGRQDVSDLDQALVHIGDLVNDTIGPILRPFFDAIGSMWNVALAAINLDVGAAFDALVGLVEGFKDLFMAPFQTVWNLIPQGFKSMFPDMNEHITNGLNVMRGLFANAVDAVIDMLNAINDFSWDGMQIFSGNPDWGIPDIGIPPGSFQLWPELSHVGGRGGGPGGKRGGFASGTDNAPRGWAWVGERGPELMRFRGGEQVVPNRRSMAMAGGGSTFNVNVYAGVGDPVEIGRVAVRAIQQYEKRAGSLWRK